jgi:2-alkyl-3-oxoalkanoate reductase
MTHTSSETRILVTGASGLVGSHAVKLLAERGYKVRAMLRATSDPKWKTLFESLNCQVVTADLLKADQLDAVCAGCDAVVHAGAIVAAHGNPADFFHVNVTGTENILNAASRTGVRHFVHISSLSVITGHGDKVRAAEDTPLMYSNEPYANSKVDAEKFVINAHAAGLIPVTCLRPGFIYGPEERTWLPRLITSLWEGSAWLVDGGARETNVIYVENLCRAIASALLNPKTYGQVYNLTDGERVTKRQLCDTVCDALGVRRVKRSMPRPLAFLLTEFVSLIAPALPGGLRSKLGRYSRGAYRLVAVNQGFDISKAERELGYTERISFVEGMKQTLSGLELNRGQIVSVRQTGTVPIGGGIFESNYRQQVAGTDGSTC